MRKRISVLVVEDEVHVQLALEYNLRLDGFDVYLADDGASGIEMAHRLKPDLILCDWMMPLMDGLEVMSELKWDKHTKDIPVFMFSAKGTIADIERAFEVGADDYITKPFDPEKLGGVLKKKLEYAKVRRKRDRRREKARTGGLCSAPW